MRSVLVINPNTTQAVTDKVLAVCRASQPQLHWHGLTAAFGAPYVATEASYAVAAHAVLDAYERCREPHDAVLIACFGDPGLMALREVAGVPVAGLAQASFEAAALRGPFGVVTGGRAWGPMLERFARMHQLDAGLRSIRTVELTGAQIAEDPLAAMQTLAGACRECADAGARHVVLGGAGLAGLAAQLQPMVDIALLDNVLLGAQAAAALAESRTAA